jgi:predicted DCC family thiol-disulfide oxidoreductase YuxK
MTDMIVQYPITLLYDGACRLCQLEMRTLLARDTAGRLDLVDIAAADFDPGLYGIGLEAMRAALHAVDGDGRVHRGVDSLVLAYRAVGLGWALAPTRWPGLAPIFDLAYRVFARHRYGVSRVFAPLLDGLLRRHARRAAARMTPCRDGACSHEQQPSFLTAKEK